MPVTPMKEITLCTAGRFPLSELEALIIQRKLPGQMLSIADGRSD